MKLDRLDHFPPALMEIGPQDIRRVLSNPTLIEIAGRRAPPLFVSTLLHGNETTSFFVLQDLARRFQAAAPARALMVFIGNVEATEAGLRFLPGTEDFNRVWAPDPAPGPGSDRSPLRDLAAEVTRVARAAAPFASIDIHNNTGANPLYGCVNKLAPADLSLAGLFSRLGVYYRNPKTTQSMAFSQFCPAVTIECGKNGNELGISRAIDFVQDVLHLSELPSGAAKPSDLSMFETVGRVVVAEDVTFSFNDTTADCVLNPQLERLNFTQMSAGSVWAQAGETGAGGAGRAPLRVLDENGDEITPEFFSFDDGVVRLKKPMTPAMITLDKTVIRQDCLGYLMAPARV